MKDREILFRPPVLDSDANQSDSNDAYFENDIRRYPLLTEKEEFELSEKMEDGKIAAVLLSSDELSPDDRDGLEYRLKVAEAARARMIASNTRLVIHWAQRMGRDPEVVMDLVQEGSIGLIRAVDKFDRHRGYKLSTYATWWIKQSIHRSLPGYEELRIPIHNHDKRNKLYQLAETFVKECGVRPSPSDLVELSDMPIGTVRYLTRKLTYQSLDKSVYGEDGETVGDRFVDDEIDTEFEAVSELNFQQLQQVMSDVLTDKQQYVVEHAVLHEKTYKEIGDEFGLTRERIRQIIQQSFILLRNHPAVVRMRKPTL
jgi:RNA polymerase primary sigma factor